MNAAVDAARRQMVEQQIRTWEVLDPRVIEVFEAVPRERFVPAAFREVAFADAPIPLGHGQHMLPPKLDGRILQALDVRPDAEVLDVGTGSGYLAACLSESGGRVRSLEIHADLAERATANLRDTGHSRVAVEVADASRLAESDRYDAIAVTCALPVYDRRYERALKVGGRLFVVIGRAPLMVAKLVTRASAEEWHADNLFETLLDPMLNAAPPSAFRF
jgi:protein-L-isoaspartate(D-aspartate) O-methyltransferase